MVRHSHQEDEPLRARLVCIECKRRKRACIGAQPVYVDGVLLGTGECSFCVRNGLVCRWPARENKRRRGNIKGEKTEDVESTDVVDGNGYASDFEVGLPNAIFSPQSTDFTPAGQFAATGLPLHSLFQQLGGRISLPLNMAMSGPNSSLFMWPNEFGLQSPIPAGNPLSIDYLLEAGFATPRPGPELGLGPPLPSTDCINWMISTFFEFHVDMGRNVAINRAHFLTAAVEPSGETSPCFWILLWGTTVLLDKDPSNSNQFYHPELNAATRKAIADQARTALLVGLQAISSDMCMIEEGLLPTDPAHLSLVARRIIPMLQGLILGMLFYERAGGTRNMVALVALIIRLGTLASTTLKNWIVHVTQLTQVDGPPEGRLHDGNPEIEEWLARHGMASLLPAQLSLAYRTKSAAELALLPVQDLEDVLLLGEFASCFFYADGLEVWGADLLGTPIKNGPNERDHVPIPFDGRGFDCGDLSRNPYLGTGRLSRLRRVGFSRPPRGLPLISVVPSGYLSKSLSPTATEEERKLFWLSTVTDSFRSGPHLLAAILFYIERPAVALRFRAVELGFPRVYPEGVRGSEEIALEHARLRMLMREALDAIPPIVSSLVSESRIEEVIEITMDCPSWVGQQNWTGFFIWIYEALASSVTPPPDVDPEPEWYGSADGIEAATTAILASRIISGMLDSGFDVNNHYFLSWYHTRIERLARVVFLHLQNARTRGLPTCELFQNSLSRYLSWFRGLEGQERYREWIDRLGESPVKSESGGITYEEEEEAVNAFARMVVSAEDRRLVRFRNEMANINQAVQSLV